MASPTDNRQSRFWPTPGEYPGPVRNPPGTVKRSLFDEVAEKLEKTTRNYEHLKIVHEDTTKKWKQAEAKCKETSDALKDLRERSGVLTSEVATLQAEAEVRQQARSAAEAQKDREREEERQMCENIRATLAEENEKLRKQLAEALFELKLLKEK